MALFGAEPCTSRLISAQREALWLDLFGFIPAYAAFLTLGAFALRSAGRGLAMAAGAAFLIAALLDGVEGIVLFRLLAAFPGSPDLFDLLFWTVRPKFALLSLGAILLAALAWRLPPLGKIAAGPLLAGGLVSLATLVTTPHDPTMMKGHAAACVALLALAAIGSARPAWVTRTP